MVLGKILAFLRRGEELMGDDLEKRMRRLISDAEADIGFDRDAFLKNPMEEWLRVWWRTLRRTLPPSKE